MKHSDLKRTHAETGTMLALTLACYVTAAVCALVMSHTLVTLVARDLGRQATAVVVVAPDGL